MAQYTHSAAQEAFYVVVVDDTPAVLAQVAGIFDEVGIPYVAFADGARALQLLRRAQRLPAVVLADLMMPDLDGWALIRAMREAPSLRTVPVVVMTALPFSSSVPDDIAVVRKPLTKARLVAAILRAATPVVARRQIDSK